MQNLAYIRHKISIGDSPYLSEQDSEILRSQGEGVLESIIKLSSPSGIYRGQVIDDTHTSLRVEILQQVDEPTPTAPKDYITLHQAIMHHEKFKILLEKLSEIGVDRIVPITTEYTRVNMKKFEKNRGLYNKIIRDSKEQSRRPYPLELDSVADLSDITAVPDWCNIAMVTEPGLKPAPLDILTDDIKRNSVSYIIGPETGWSRADLTTLSKQGFKPTSLAGNILRTETAAIAVGSIIKFIKNS